MSIWLVSCNINNELDGKGSISGATQTTNTIASAQVRLDFGNRTLATVYNNTSLDAIEIALYKNSTEVGRTDLKLVNDSTGQYKFQALDPGSYTIKFFINNTFFEKISGVKVFANEETVVRTIYINDSNPFISEYNENTAEECSDGMDNDFDGKIDCKDAGCVAFIFCAQDSLDAEIPSDSLSGESSSSIEEMPISSNNSSSFEDLSLHEESSSSERDSDEFSSSIPFSSAPDSSSSSSSEIKIIEEPQSSSEYSSSSISENEGSYRKCSDNMDNDLDGIVDCDEISCMPFKHCYAFLEDSGKECHDNIDNDGNGFVDCEDKNCASYCSEDFSQESSNFKCSDNLDNDQDGLVDCFDEDCAEQSVCASDDVIGIRTLVLNEDSISFNHENYFGMTLFHSTEFGSEVKVDRPLLNAVNCSYGRIFLSNHSVNDEVKTVDMRNFFDKKYRFSMRTNCVSDSLLLGMSWSNGKGEIADSEPLFLNDLVMDSTVVKINNSEWHHFEVDFIRLGRELVSQLHSFTLVHCNQSPKEESLMLEIDNMHFYGAADMHCIEVIHKDMGSTRNYCQYNGQEVLVMQKTIDN